MGGEDHILPEYKVTALKAAEEMPIHVSHKDQSNFIYHYMEKAHPGIAWGCEAVRRTTGQWADTSKLWYSSKASNLLTFKVGSELSIRVFAL